MFSSFALTEEQQARRMAQRGRKLAWERKRRMEQELQKVLIIPPRDLNERQKEWIGRNCQPKTFTFAKKPIVYSRWAKRGPMSRSDWVKFFKWADKNAEPKPKPKPHCKLVPHPPKKKRHDMSPEEIWEHIDLLATPKTRRGKFEYPKPIKYPYSPRIHFRIPAKRDRGRPFAPPKVPNDFQHIELELDFWHKLRFPVRRSALTYIPSLSVIEMAKPHVVPPLDPHCPIPQKPVEYVAPRKRMTQGQWEKHKCRLYYLAAPLKRRIVKGKR